MGRLRLDGVVVQCGVCAVSLYDAGLAGEVRNQSGSVACFQLRGVAPVVIATEVIEGGLMGYFAQQSAPISPMLNSLAWGSSIRSTCSG